ncbi:selenoprotein T, 1b [Strigomonas culicis]|uniref:Selenoprotein T, 1b n=1 Tax=Strigomonas culicis TaxID=28005 RepID=S9UV51_9TRYP|nr:selenoprotein T, 1b [Strigomonas culicis]|eukprot:EPY32783.1 selenoprotein T, 1b [Strigomonas culicis]
MQLQLRTQLPTADEVTIEGETFPVTPLKKAVGQLCATWFLVAIGIALMADHLPPQVRQLARENRAAILISAFALNMFGSSLTQSGAFEVFVDDQLVYSKLQTGVTPSVELVGELILNTTLLAKYLP